MEHMGIYYSVSGREDRPWLVFIHGLMGSHANWRRIIRAFESTYRILTYDQRFHGRSGQDFKGTAPEDYASDLALLLAHLHVNRCSLVGHSMGARTAQCYAARHPQTVDHLVIEDMGPDMNEKAGSRLVQLLENVPVPFASKREAKAYLMTHFEDRLLGAFLYTSIKENEKGEAIWAVDMRAMIETIRQGRRHDRWAEWKSLKIPSLVVRGARSDELSHDVFERMLKANSHAQGQEVPNAGHWVHFDQPEIFIKLLADFLAHG